MKKLPRRLLLERLEDRTVPTIWGVPWPDPTHLTISFVPDGTKLSDGGASDLFKTMNAVAPTAVWEGEILRAFQTWAAAANINVGVVADDGSQMGVAGAVEGDPRFGDIRIAATSMSTTGEIAAGSPFSWTGSTTDGDVYFNDQAQFSIGIVAAKFDLYSVALHEAGHVFGFADSTDPNSVEDVCYSFHTGLSASDTQNLQTLYGLRQSDSTNNSFSSATAIPVSLNHGQIDGELSTTSDSDYFKVSAPLLGLISSIQFRVNAVGLSLVSPTLTVYNAFHQQLGVRTTTDPLNNDVVFTVGNLLPGETYYVRVSSGSNDVFGVGGYQLSADFLTLGIVPPLDPVTRFSPVVDAHTNDSLSRATTIQGNSATANNSFDVSYQAQISDSTDVDYYKVQVPSTAQGASVNLVVMVWALDPNSLNPRIHLFDGNGNPVAFQVLSNDSGVMSVQVQGFVPSKFMYVSVAARDNTDKAHNTGNYFLAMQFGQTTPFAFDGLAAGTLGASNSSDTGTLTVNTPSMMEFALSANTLTGTNQNVTVTMTIEDANGNVVATLTATTGQPTVTTNIFLDAGDYQVLYTASVAGGGSLPDVSYSALVCALSDPQGPTATTVSQGGSTNATSTGGGYSYTGSSSTTTSGKQTYY
jgi:hypothetical protein